MHTMAAALLSSLSLLQLCSAGLPAADSGGGASLRCSLSGVVAHASGSADGACVCDAPFGGANCSALDMVGAAPGAGTPGVLQQVFAGAKQARPALSASRPVRRALLNVTGQSRVTLSLRKRALLKEQPVTYGRRKAA